MGALFGQSNVPAWERGCDRLWSDGCAGGGGGRDGVEHAIGDVFVGLDVEVFVVIDGEDELDVVAGTEVEGGVSGEETLVRVGRIGAADELRDEEVGNGGVWTPGGGVVEIQLVF